MRTGEEVLRVGLVGLGSVCGGVHYPALKGIPGVEIVGICDVDAPRLAQRRQEWQAAAAFARLEDMLGEAAPEAVVIATPNVCHQELVLKALEAGCHVLCEKPLGMTVAETAAMYRAGRDSGRRHMTAFTYRFVPAMNYLCHLVRQGELGEIRHARFQRLQDWGEGPIGWRQYRDQAGSGELGDMGIHRIDFAELLLGPIGSVCGAVRQLIPRAQDRQGNRCAPQDVEDWVAWIAEFEGGATGVFEMGKLTKGRGPGGGHDEAELNGSEASAVYQLHAPHQILFARRGQPYAPRPVPEALLTWPGSPRDPHAGEPVRTFRYDQDWEFVCAIRENRDCVPSFFQGMRAQVVAETILKASARRCWLEVPMCQP